MADAKISALPTGQFQSTDYIPYVDGASGITRKATKQELRGSMGSQGSASTVTGPTGPTGNQGTQGSIGPQGTQGSQGSLGATGPTGNQGTQGSVGPQGTQGSQGSASTVTGPTGPQGTQGSIGPQGTQGSQGSQGATGPTGYAVPRIASSVTGGTVAPDADNTDIREITAQDQAIFFDTPSGTPVDGQKMIIQIKYSGTAGTISFTGSWTAGGVALPTAGVTGKHLHLGFMYVTANSFNKWMLLASAQQS